MTSAAYTAKSWLMRADAIERARIRATDRVLLIEAKVNNCVSSYEVTGRRDPLSAIAAHDDLIADYASAREEYEKITNLVIYEDVISIKTINKMPNAMHRALLIDSYLNRHTWKSIIKSGKYEIKQSQIYLHHEKALEELGAILNPETDILTIEKPNKCLASVI